MNDLDMLLSDMKEYCIYKKFYEAEIFLKNASLDTLEMFRDCSSDIEEQVKEELGEEIWDHIQEELEYIQPADKSNNKHNIVE